MKGRQYVQSRDREGVCEDKTILAPQVVDYIYYGSGSSLLPRLEELNNLTGLS